MGEDRRTNFEGIIYKATNKIDSTVKNKIEGASR